MGQQEHREAQERRRVTGSPSRPKRRSIWLACACVASHSALSSLRLRTTLNLSAELPPQSVGLVAVCTRAQLPHNELPEHGTQHTSYPDGGSCAERAPAASARALLDRRHLVRDGASPLASSAPLQQHFPISALAFARWQDVSPSEGKASVLLRKADWPDHVSLEMPLRHLVPGSQVPPPRVRCTWPCPSTLPHPLTPSIHSGRT